METVVWMAIYRHYVDTQRGHQAVSELNMLYVHVLVGRLLLRSVNDRFMCVSVFWVLYIHKMSLQFEHPVDRFENQTA